MAKGVAKGSFSLQLMGVREGKQQFMLRIGMLPALRHAALAESAKLVKKDIVKRAPPYPLSMLKHGKRWWSLPVSKPTLKQSIKIVYRSGNKYTEDVMIGPTRDKKRWKALEWGHSHGFYGPRPFIRPALAENVKQIRAITKRHYKKLK